ncbi:MAG: CAP domain-containing protein [Chitinophagaceae bacterium]|nr:CAP domain-containing protein [Chitinophagaceae bacterium]
MKRLCLLFIVIAFQFSAKSQGSARFTDKEFIFSSPRDKSIDSILQEQEGYKNLTAEEKEVIYWINYVRKHPKKFNTEILALFLKQFQEVKGSYAQSLSSELSSAPSLPILLPLQKLNTVASKHARDLGSSGSGISHYSSSGASFQQRMKEAGLTSCVAENVYEGKQEPLQSVIFLLIDNGVKNLGHRKNLLAASNKYIGISFYPIKNKRPYYFLVQNFLCE